MIENPYTVISLTYPVKFKGQDYNQVPLRRPRIKDLRHLTGPSASTDPIAAQNNFLGALAELPPGFFDEVDIEDAEQFTAYVDSFMKVEKKPADSSTNGD